MVCSEFKYSVKLLFILPKYMRMVFILDVRWICFLLGVWSVLFESHMLWSPWKVLMLFFFCPISEALIDELLIVTVNIAASKDKRAFFLCVFSFSRIHAMSFIRQVWEETAKVERSFETSKVILYNLLASIWNSCLMLKMLTVTVRFLLYSFLELSLILIVS